MKMGSLSFHSDLLRRLEYKPKGCFDAIATSELETVKGLEIARTKINWYSRLLFTPNFHHTQG